MKTPLGLPRTSITSAAFVSLMIALALGKFPSAGFASLRDDCYKLNVAEHDGWQIKAFSADGNYILAQNGDDKLIVLDSASLKPVGPPLKYYAYDYPAAISPDGARIAIGEDGGRIHILDARTGNSIIAETVDANFASPLAFSRDNRFLLARTPGHIVLLDANTGKTVARPIDAPHQWSGGITSVQLSPDGRTVLITHEDRPARLWDVQTGKALHTLDTTLWSMRDPDAITDHASAAAFSSDGSMIATAETIIDNEGKWEDVGRVWDTRSGRLLFTTSKMSHFVPAVAFSRDSRLLAVGAYGVTVFDIGRKTAITHEMGASFERYSLGVGFSPDGKRVFAVGGGGQAKVFDVATQKQLFDFAMNDVTTIGHFNSDGSRFITSGYGLGSPSAAGIYAWDVSKSPAK